MTPAERPGVEVPVLQPGCQRYDRDVALDHSGSEREKRKQAMSSHTAGEGEGRTGKVSPDEAHDDKHT